MNINALIYDIEIKRAIPDPKSQPLEGIEYCEGWHDHAGMGISVLGAWCCKTNLPLVFADDNCHQLANNHANYDYFVSFNGINFDNKVIKASWDLTIPDRLCYDILRELWIADGLDPDKFSPRTHGGYGLDVCAQINFGVGKSGNGALAPILYQRGQIGELISYCLRDVMITRRLFMKLCTNGGVIKHPKTGADIKLRTPWEKPAGQETLFGELISTANEYTQGEV